MLFNSYVFLLGFLPAVLVGYYLLLPKGYALRQIWLVGASFVFYGWWNPAYIVLLAGSILGNYLIYIWQLKLQETKPTGKRRRVRDFDEKLAVFCGIAFNIGLLGFFKYADFVLLNVGYLTQSHIDLLNIALPLGISFFSLQQVAFQVDAYEGVVKERGLTNYALFVSFFPQLVAGPIVHHSEMMGQLKDTSNQTFNSKNFYAGLLLFMLGVFKKVVIADSYSPWVANGFDSSASLTFLQGWFSSFAYTLQLYFDFSAYSDMALGLGLMFNLKLPLNFDRPLRSTSIIEFWTRWHMTLGRFIRTYLHFPLSRAMPKATFGYGLVATILAMLIAGLWHGAAWTFVIFGAIHGLGLAVNNTSRKFKLTIPGPIGWLLTMLLITHANVFFRAKTMDDANKVLSAMYDFSSISLDLGQFMMLTGEPYIIYILVYLFALFGGLLAVLLLPTTISIADRFEPNRRFAWLLGSVMVVSMLFMQEPTEFLYFNF